MEQVVEREKLAKAKEGEEEEEEEEVMKTEHPREGANRAKVEVEKVARTR